MGLSNAEKEKILTQLGRDVPCSVLEFLFEVMGRADWVLKTFKLTPKDSSYGIKMVACGVLTAIGGLPKNDIPVLVGINQAGFWSRWLVKEEFKKFVTWCREEFVHKKYLEFLQQDMSYVFQLEEEIAHWHSEASLAFLRRVHEDFNGVFMRGNIWGKGFLAIRTLGPVLREKTRLHGHDKDMLPREQFYSTVSEIEEDATRKFDRWIKGPREATEKAIGDEKVLESLKIREKENEQEKENQPDLGTVPSS